MSFCYPVLHYPLCMVKDATQRAVRVVHHWVHNRNIYPVPKHQNIRCYKTIKPIVDDAAFVAPSASIVGNVIMGHDASAMYHCCIRNYHTEVATRIGDGTSLLENVSFMGQCTVGNNCVIGVGSTLDSCTIHENVILGSHCNIALGAVVEQGAIVAAGSTVPRDARVPANELWAGIPAVKIGDVTEEQRATANAMVRKHVKLAKEHRIAVQHHYEESAKLDDDWLVEMCKKMDAQHQAVSFPEDIHVPIEGKRFLQPKLHIRLPQMHQRISYPINRIAPHKSRLPDWTGNA